MGVSNSTAMIDTSACGITRPAWPTMIIPADTAETALDRAARHARGAWRIHGAAGQPGALPAVQPTTTPAPSVASLAPRAAVLRMFSPRLTDDGRLEPQL